MSKVSYNVIIYIYIYTSIYIALLVEKNLQEGRASFSTSNIHNSRTCSRIQFKNLLQNKYVFSLDIKDAEERLETLGPIHEANIQQFLS